MSGPNGRQRRAIENLAAALNECFDAAVEKSTQAAVEKSTQAAEQNRQEINARLDRQDDTLHQQNDTLRMIWTQCGGKADVRLPVDD